MLSPRSRRPRLGRGALHLHLGAQTPNLVEQLRDKRLAGLDPLTQLRVSKPPSTLTHRSPRREHTRAAPRHRKLHCGVNLGKQPWLKIEPKKTVRSALHTRTNGVGNTIIVTFEALPYELRGGDECHRRLEANKVLKKAKIKWRFRTKKPKKGTRRRKPPQGPCARKIMGGNVIADLCEIFYAETISEAQRGALRRLELLRVPARRRELKGPNDSRSSGSKRPHDLRRYGCGADGALVWVWRANGRPPPPNPHLALTRLKATCACRTFEHGQRAERSERQPIQRLKAAPRPAEVWLRCR